VRFCSRLIAVVLLLSLGKAWAGAEDSPVETARNCHAHGVELFEQGDYPGALQAFHDAYKASPHFAVFYNIGQAQIALNRLPEAFATLSRYLREGQDQIPAERREQVGEQIKLLEALLGELEVRTDPTGALITVDGHGIGHTPLSEPIHLAAGEHSISTSLDGYQPAERTVVSGQGERLVLHLELLPTPKVDSIGSISVEPPPTPIPVRSDLRTALPYVLAGAGLALGGGALGVYLWKRSEYRQWQAGEAALHDETKGTASYQTKAAEVNRLSASLTSANHAIIGLAVASGTLVAAGATIYLLDHASARGSGTFTVVWTGGSSIAAGWSGVW